MDGLAPDTLGSKISSQTGGQPAQNQLSKIQRRLRAISGDSNDNQQKLTATTLKEKAKKSMSASFTLVAREDVPNEIEDRSDTEIEKINKNN